MFASEHFAGKSISHGRTGAASSFRITATLLLPCLILAPFTSGVLLSCRAWWYHRASAKIAGAAAAPHICVRTYVFNALANWPILVVARISFVTSKLQIVERKREAEATCQKRAGIMAGAIL